MELLKFCADRRLTIGETEGRLPIIGEGVSETAFRLPTLGEGVSETEGRFFTIGEGILRRLSSFMSSNSVLLLLYLSDCFTATDTTCSDARRCLGGGLSPSDGRSSSSDLLLFRLLLLYLSPTTEILLSRKFFV